MFAILNLLLTISRGFEPIPLESQINALVADHKGTVAVAVKHLGTGETFIRKPDEVMPTASLIKLAVMAEVYFQAKEGKVKVDEMLTLKKDDMVQGSGILTEHFSPGASFSLRDAVRLMVVYSDNTATNLVLDKAGIKSVNERMAGLGLKETRINAKVFKGSTTSVDPERTKKFGLGSSTATEMLKLLEMLHKGELVSADASKAMIEHMKKCDDKDKFPRFLPKGVTIAHKTGSVSDARTDAGILYFKEGPIALVVLTSQNEDKTWTPDNAGNKLCADIARAVVEHYQKSASTAGPPKK
ncbi:MAG TPA: serine hydrolase [Gemmataceae bacterium]|jgi:beta-lactamase class A|nr:serine hydrolase [Gemmataceae bacterium]